MGGEFGPGQLFLAAVFVERHHGDGVITAAQQVFGEVQRSAREPLGAGHLRTLHQYRVRRVVKANLEEIDNGLPEGLALIDAPGVQGRVVVQLQLMSRVDELAKGVHARLGDAFGVGLPEDVGHGVPLVFVYTQTIERPILVVRDLSPLCGSKACPRWPHRGSTARPRFRSSRASLALTDKSPRHKGSQGIYWANHPPSIFHAAPRTWLPASLHRNSTSSPVAAG